LHSGVDAHAGQAGASLPHNTVDEAENISLNHQNAGRWIRLIVLAAAACLPALAAPALSARTSALYSVAANGNAYFVAGHAALLYLATPVAVLSSFLWFLLPGLLAALLLRAGQRVEELLLFGFALSLLFCPVVSALAKLAFGVPVVTSAFFLLWLALNVALAFLVLARRGAAARLAVAQPAALRRIGQIILLTWLTLALLIPKIFWENFNVDGVEAFEFGRSLTWHYFPQWAVQDGVLVSHNFVLFAFPNHWFTTLLGPIEAAARLPFSCTWGCCLPLVLLIERASARSCDRAKKLCSGWACCSTSWFKRTTRTTTPSLPTWPDGGDRYAVGSLFPRRDSCTLVESPRLVFLFAVLSYLASPGGLMLLGALAALIVVTPVPERPAHLKTVIAALLACVLISFLYEAVYVPAVFGRMKANQFSSISLVARLFPPTLNEFVRLNALLFTSGLLPALAAGVALTRRRTDPVAFVLAGVTLLFFAALYIQPWTSLHQFTPVMVLPIVVFWRVYLSVQPRWQRWLLTGMVCATALCLFLSLPQHFRTNVTARELGRATDLRIGDAGLGYPRATQAGWAASVLVPQGYRLEYPNQPWGTDAYTWLYYSQRPAKVRINYMVQPTREVPPEGFSRIDVRNDIALYVRDAQEWQQLRQTDFPRVVVSPLYEPILRQSVEFFRDYTEAHRAKPPTQR
jgi:hypothetical protein